MAKSNGCIWVVEWARPRNGSGAAKPLTWRFLAAFNKVKEAKEYVGQCEDYDDEPGADIYRVTKYVQAAK